MSMGYGATCRKVSEDTASVLYEYYAYNLNEENSRNPDKIYDGTILIQKTCLSKPDLTEHLSAGHIEITNSSFAWQFASNNIDLMAVRLCQNVFRKYQDSGTLPEVWGYHV